MIRRKNSRPCLLSLCISHINLNCVAINPSERRGTDWERSWVIDTCPVYALRVALAVFKVYLSLGENVRVAVVVEVGSLSVWLW